MIPFISSMIVVFTCLSHLLILSSFEMRIMLQHPDVGEHYKNEQILRDSQPKSYFFSEWSQYIYQQSLCYSSIELVRFQLVGSYEKLTRRPILTNLDLVTKYDIRAFYERDTNNLINMNVALVESNYFQSIPPRRKLDKDKIVNVEVIACAITTSAIWAIENGTNMNKFYVVIQNKEKIDWPPHILGLVERAAERDYSMNGTELQIAFEDSLLKHGGTGGGKAKKNICEIVGLGRYRACSTVYMAWLKETPRYPVLNRVLYTEYDDCVNDQILVHFNGYGPLSLQEPDYHSIDLVPCAVNRQWKSPNFYLTADQKSDGAAYVLKRSKHNTFKLVMHVVNVAVLKESFTRL